MTTVEKIKAKILDLAIRGKLVPQDPNDEPASELLKRIRAEKEELVKAKKIKKEKNPSEIVIGSDGRPYEKFADGKTVCIEDEIPFDLPNGWAWARIGDVFDLQAGKNIKADCIYEQASPGHPFACFGGNGIRGYVDSSNVQGIHAIIGRQGALCGNINLSTEKFYATEHAVVVTTFANTEALFAFHFLKAMNLNRLATATAQPGLSVAIVNQNLMPVPPLAEQKRIVSKIEELLAAVEKISVALDGVTRVAERINKKVLDLAIRGQLVPQDPNDEPAEKLLKRIAEARQHSTNMNSRKSKREEFVIFYGADRSAYETRNGKTVCIDDEIPFDIPDSWAWARLESVVQFLSGNTPSKDLFAKHGIPYFKVAEMNLPGNEKYLFYTELHIHPSASVKVFPSNTIVFPKNGGAMLTNKKRILVQESVCDLNTGGLFPHVADVCEYLFAWFASIDLSKYVKGGVIPTTDADRLRNTLIPLPPLAEQKRIVARIEEVRKLTQSLTK